MNPRIISHVDQRTHDMTANNEIVKKNWIPYGAHCIWIVVLIEDGKVTDSAKMNDDTKMNEGAKMNGGAKMTGGANVTDDDQKLGEANSNDRASVMTRSLWMHEATLTTFWVNTLGCSMSVDLELKMMVDFDSYCELHQLLRRRLNALLDRLKSGPTVPMASNLNAKDQQRH